MNSWMDLPTYQGCRTPIPAGARCRIVDAGPATGRVVTVVCPLVPTANGTLVPGEFNLSGTQFWRIQSADGTTGEIARAHLSRPIKKGEVAS